MRSMRWRLVGSYVLVALLATMVVGALSLYIVNRYFAQTERALLSESARVAAEDVASLLWPEPNLARLQHLATGYGVLGQTRMIVLSSEGVPLADSGPLSRARAEAMTRIVVSQAVVSESGTEIHLRYHRSDSSLVPGTPQVPREVGENTIRVPLAATLRGLSLGPALTGPMIPNGPFAWQARSRLAVSLVNATAPVRGPDGLIVGYVQLSERPDYRGQAMGSLLRALVWAGLAAVAIASVTGLFISRNLSAPLAGLATTAKRMGAGDLGARAETRRKDEIGELATQLNVMAERLEESFRGLANDRDAMRRFAADAAHELRTPITALKTFNELLMGKAQEDDSTRREFLSESRAQIERLDWLTKNLQELSRMDAGLLQLQRGVHDLRELIEHVTASFQHQATNRGIALRHALPETPVQVNLDPTRIEQVLSNLLSNALKLTPQGGSVTVGLKVAVEQVSLWVQDTGPGIPEEELPNVFDRFFRGSQGRTQEGSGLGLAIVQGIVEAHGGRVAVRSQPGSGSCFTVHLPR